MNSEKVSVIIPAYNAADTLGEAINSILQGTYQNLEILIIDDCSTDNTGEVVAQIIQKDSRVQYYRNEKNCGVSKSRNLMIHKATGTYVAFLDSDDTWEPNKLEVCLKILKDNPDIKASAHALSYMDKHGKKASYIPTYPTTSEEVKAIRERGELPWVFPSSVVVEREVLLQEGGFAEDWKVGEDTELFARIAQKYGMLATKMSLGNYRIRGNSLTDKHWFKKRIAADCVKENQRRRMRGEKEFSIHEFEQVYFQDLPPLEKFNKYRKLLALHYMRKAGQCWLNRELLPALIYGIATTTLNPVASLQKLQWMKYQEGLSKQSK